MDALKALDSGRGILEPVLVPAGFAYALVNTGDSSGGHFASGVFQRDNRRLQLSFRYSLGLVTYSVGDYTLSHSDYARALGHDADSAYPGFSSDPLDGFRHLRQDLERFGSEFLSGDDADFERRFAWVERNPEPRGIGAV